MTFSLVSLLAVIFIIGVLGVASYFIGSAPGIDPQFKGLIKWILILIAVVIALLYVWSLISGAANGIIIK